MNKKIRKLAVLAKNRINKHPIISNPKIIMTLLVKNEEELLETNLRFHKAMGVDGFIVTDNNSTDKTPQIIKKYVEKGWILRSILDKTQGYAQVKLVNKMICIARDELKADWVINADADELWYCSSYDYKNTLSKSRANVIKCPVYAMFPEMEGEFWESKYRVMKNIDNDRKYDVGKYSLYAPQIGKVIHRTKGYQLISEGNHNVKMNRKSYQNAEDIKIYHYNIRRKEQFITKMVGGGKQLTMGTLHKGGGHWKYFYDLSKTEGFDEQMVYDRAIGLRYKETFIQEGVLLLDTDVIHFIKSKQDGIANG